MGFYDHLLLLSISIFVTAIGEAQVQPFLINCGSNSSITTEGRTWVGDSIPGNNFTLTIPGIASSVVSEDPTQPASYKTARLFDTPSTYNFTITPGSYSIRLHFFSSKSLFANHRNANESSFDAFANNLKLISKFSVPGEVMWRNEASKSNSSYLVKEYFLNVDRNSISIRFIPDEGSFAFVNAIELIPVAGNLFLDLGDNGIETMYRLNVGGRAMENWDSDERFMFSVNAATAIKNSTNISYADSGGSSVAPLLIYETARATTNTQVVEKRFNMSWRFDVDPGFEYLVRLHFCELFYDKPNQRVFKIYINNKTAAENFDVFLRGKGMNKAFHEDFVDTVSDPVDTIWVQLGPDTMAGAPGTDALLNGLEIFKLGRNGNLAHVLSRIDAGEGTAGKPKSITLFVAVITVIAVVSTVLFVISGVVCLYIHKRRASRTKEDEPSWRPLFLHAITGSPANARDCKLQYNATNRTGRVFGLAVIKTATNNFDESLIIGTGGFGKVYKGEIEGMVVAIKRANPQSQQGLKEFETEIEILSKLRHRHLVSMIGYCDEQNEMILVYEYMANGTLRSHLFGSELPPLTWKQRIEVCIGAARGLHYLHTGAERGIIHRDVKTTNILLDECFVAKMADFGLSKDGPALDQTHVSTAVKGSFGYLDPEYFRRQQLTEKSDVYSFGVVLFEVVCCRPVIDPTLPREQVNLAEWALRWQRQRALETIVDPRLEGGFSQGSMKKFAEIAEKCLADEGKDRPAMGDILWHLECVLQLEEESQNGGEDDADENSTEGNVHETGAADCFGDGQA